MRFLGEVYEYQVKVSRPGGLVCLLIGVAILVVLAVVIVFIARRRK